MSSTPTGLRPDYDLALPDLLTDSSSSRAVVFRMIPAGSLVLDVGCDTGRMGYELISRKQCAVDGIEPFEGAAKQAEERLRRVWMVSVENADGADIPQYYDVVMFLDVLEHLVDPWHALRWGVSRLRSGGLVICSVPNIAHISVVRRLLGGKFEYEKHGTMDRTHLRWFTRSSLVDSLRGVGLGNVQAMMLPLVPRFAPGSKASRFAGWLAMQTVPDLIAGTIVGVGSAR